MKTLDQIKTQFNKTTTRDEFVKLMMDAIELIEFSQTQNEMTKLKLKKTEDQTKRQTDMITNLENTLWKKK